MLFVRALSLTFIFMAAALIAQDATEGKASKSWINIVDPGSDKILSEGDAWNVTVEYFLDAADDAGGTSLILQALGPWVDLPDGVYEKTRHHVNFSGGKLRDAVKIKTGEGKHTFNFTLPTALPHNSLILIANFTDAKGKAFRWQVRGEGPHFVRNSGNFELTGAKPGNLFTYDEPVKMIARLKNVKDAGQEKTMSVKVYDSSKAVIEQKEIKFKAEKDGQEIAIDLAPKTRGTFLLEADVHGWEKRSTTFCRIPDVAAITKGQRTAFGLHNIAGMGAPERIEDICKIAQRLGLSVSRNFISWSSLNPARGKYHLESIDKSIDLQRKYGIDPVICVINPPVWALKGAARDIHYQAFDGDMDAWRDFVKEATTHYKGRIYAWEWLNEIVPGEGKQPVQAYLELVKTGTETARAIDPQVKFLLAGGLFPRSFRNQLLKAGVGQYVDVLPVHYSDGAGVYEARADLDSAGNKNVAVWDDETARGTNMWNVPPLEDLSNTVQSAWVVNHFSDELAAGAERIVYFGGWGDPTGGWSYLLDDLSPRPAAVTLAVLAAKTHGAKPLGSFCEGKGSFHLFDRDGKALLIGVSITGYSSVPLQVGSSSLLATEQQGNESQLSAKDNVAELPLGPIGTFFEGGDLESLKAYVVAEIQASRAEPASRSRAVDNLRVSMMKGEAGEIFVALRNPYSRALAGKLEAKLPEGWPAGAALAFSLQPGEQKLVTLSVSVPASAAAKDHSISLGVNFDEAKLPRISKPLTLSVISPEMLGNLLQNGDFESEAKKKGIAEHWGGPLASSEGLGLGLGKNVMKFSNAENWKSAGQNIPINGGDTYLYSAWVWNQDIGAGSNITHTFADGTSKTLYDVAVFKCGENNQYWQMFTCRYKSPANAKTAAFVPVCKGKGTVYYDNMRVTLFEGTDYSATAHRADAAPKIDGKLDDWKTLCPIPLIGRNQLTLVDKAYAWTPENLNAVAYAMWDDANLYLAVQIQDDVFQADGADADVIRGDSLILGVDPTNRAPDAASKAYQLYISDQKPGGGSGLHTIFRPANFSGGRNGGHLMRDSSVYELSIAKSKGGCVYELRIPFSEIGVQPGMGRKIAFSIQLNDNDGKGLGAHMNWGGGLHPEFKPADFGVLTLTK
jgi:hypothetical protein